MESWRRVFKGFNNIKEKVYKDEPLCEHTSLRIGGNVSFFVEVEDAVSLQIIVNDSKEKGIPFIVLGSGTNILFGDNGFDGIVISMKRLNSIKDVSYNNDNASFFIESGHLLQRLVSLSKKEGLCGIEGLSSIPGTIGGAIYGNAGAFGYEIKDVIKCVTVMDETGFFTRLNRDEIEFGYRRAGFSENEVIINAQIILKKDDKRLVAEKINGFEAKKRDTQPLSEVSAGSVFKNPPGDYAGRLIEESGCKGMRERGIEVSKKHANFFLNRGGGSASDFLRLMDKVNSKVRNNFSIELEPEIRIIN